MAGNDRDVTFHVHVPPAPLRSYVAVAHGYRVPANPTGVHHGLPSRHLTLVVELAAPLRVGNLGGSVTAHAVAGGLHIRPALIDASQPQEGLQYALSPLGAQALLGVPAAELHEQVVDLVDLFGSTAERLVAELAATVSWPQRFGLLDTALLHRLANAGAPTSADADADADVAQAWRMIFASDGRLRVATVAASVGCSRRHLSQRFRRATGLTPKQAARVARFEAAQRLLVTPQRPALADVAARCGYADQSHFAREWHALTGCSVGAWLLDEFPFVQDREPVEPTDSLA